MNKHILIFGAGGIGRSVGLIFLDFFQDQHTITIIDSNSEALNNCKSFFKKGNLQYKNLNFHHQKCNDNFDISQLTTVDIIVDCLPGEFASGLALKAVALNCHYINITEHEDATKKITEIAKHANSTFILQTGLAPGYINILACHMFDKFVERYNVEKVNYIGMKVGALSSYASSPHFYGFTWSPIGVATEYIEKARVIKNNKIVSIDSLGNEDYEKIVVNGEEYEASITSGGASSLVDFFLGKSNSLDYKTIRYPGHFSWIKSLISELKEKDSSEELCEIMMGKVPFVEDDYILIYVEIEGFNDVGQLVSSPLGMKIKGKKINGIKLKAIQTTTASAVVELINQIILENITKKGVVFQHEISPKSFLNGEIIKKYYQKVNL